MISLAVLTIASLPVSFAIENIVSVLPEPIVSLNNDTLKYYCYSYRENYPLTHPNNYSLFEITVESSNNCDFFLVKGISSEFHLTQPATAYINNYDPVSGNLLSSSTINSTDRWSHTHNGITYPYTLLLSFVPNNTVANSYYSLPVDSRIVVSGASNPEPFITFSVEPLEQKQYHSPLSEPVADQFNSYMVIDDHLIWVSYRVNGIYTRNSSIESASELYSQSVQISESGTGSYSGSSNGYTEDISVPEGSFQGRETDYSRLFAGVYSGFDLGNIDFSSVNQGSVHFNSSGTVTFNDKEYYPVSFSQTDILSLYRLYCIPTDTDNFVFWLAPDRSLAQNTIVNMDFFFSEFDLDGNYIKSSFHSVTNTDLGLFDSYESEEDISSIRCYGIDFYNLNNLPFNLSSVLWQYDIDFAKWRDDIKTLLQSIYNTLSSDPSAPAPETYPDYAGEIPSVEIVSGASPEDAGNLFGRSQNIVPQESIFAINQWRDFFNIPDLIGACMFALTVGTIIIILGKRKSE